MTILYNSFLYLFSPRFSLANRTRIRNETLEVQKEDPFLTYVNMTKDDLRFTPYIGGGYDSQPAANASIYMPIWQTYPLVPQGSRINGNHLFPGYMANVNILVNQQHVILQALLSPAQRLKWFRSLYAKDSNYVHEPIVYMEYPILGNAADRIMIMPTTSESSQGNETKNDAVSDVNKANISLIGDTISSINTTTVGRISILFSWRDLLTGILPNHIVGMVAVFENVCNQSFTFELVSLINLCILIVVSYEAR
jgi:hypothetical protein